MVEIMLVWRITEQQVAAAARASILASFKAATAALKTAQLRLEALAAAQPRMALLVALEEVVALWAPLEATLIVREALLARRAFALPPAPTH